MAGSKTNLISNLQSILIFFLKNFMLKTLLIQALNGITLLFYYRLVAIRLDNEYQIVFFLSLSLISLAILVNDFSFAITFSKENDHSKHNIESYFSSRATLNIALVIVMFVYWNFVYKFEIENMTLFLILVLQFLECAMPNFLYIATNISEFAQVIKFFKILTVLIVFYFLGLSVDGLYLLLVTSSLIFYCIVIIDLRKRFVFKISSLFIPNRKIFNKRWKLGFFDFLPFLSALALNLAIPIFAQMGMSQQNFQKILLLDTLVKRCENLLQSVINWNLGRFNKEIHIEGKIKIAVLWVLISFCVYLALPILYSFMFAVALNSLSLLEIYAFGLIVIIGPMISIVGFRMFVFNNKSVLYFCILGIAALILWTSAYFSNILFNFIYVMPAVHIILLVLLIWVGKKNA